MFSETVASLFASLDLDASRLPAQLAEATTSLGRATADMSLSLASLEKEYAELTGMMTAQEAALLQLGVTDLSTSRARAEALELLIDKQKQWMVLIQEQEAAEVRRAAAMDTITAEVVASEQLKQKIERENAIESRRLQAEKEAAERKLNAESEAEVRRMASVRAEVLAQEAASQKEYSLLVGQLRAEEDNVNRMLAANDAEAALMAAAARKEALAQEALSQKEYSALVKELRAQETAAEVAAAEAANARVQLANQYALGEYRAALIEKKALQEEDAASTMGLGSVGGGVGKGGLSPHASLAGGTGLAIAAGGFALYEVSKQAAEFDDAMNKSLSIMGNVSDAMKGKMSDAAKQLAAQFGISGVEIAHTFYNLASSGLSAEESLKALPTVVKFAFTASADGVMKTEKAAEMLTTVVNALQGSGGSIERIADLLLQADKIAAGTGEQFAKSLAGKGAGAIRILGKDVEEGLAVLTTFSTLGIRGADAQTALVQVLRDFRVQAEKHKDVLVTLNGQTLTYGQLVYDSSGKMKNMADILRELETLFKGASNQTIAHDLALLGLNQRTTQITQAIVGFSDKMKENEAILRSSGNTMQEITDKRLDSAVTKFKELKEAMRNVAIGVGDDVLPTLLDFANGLKVILDYADRMGKRNSAGVEGPQYYKGAGTPLPNWADFNDLKHPRPIAETDQMYADALEAYGQQAKRQATTMGAIASGSSFMMLQDSQRALDAAKKMQDRITAGMDTAPTSTPDASGNDNSVVDPHAAEKLAAAADKLAQERNRIAQVDLQTAHDHQMALLKMEEDAIKSKEGLVGHDADQTFKDLQDVHRREIDETKDYNQKRLDLEYTKKTPLYVANILANDQKSGDQIAALDQQSKEHADAADRKHEDAIAHFHKFVQDLMDKDDKHADEQNTALQDKITNDHQNALKLQAQGEMDHTTRLLELWRQRADYAFRIGQISVAQHTAIIDTIDRAEDEAAIKGVDREIAALKLKKNTLTDYETQLQALENRKQVLLDAQAGRSQKSAEVIKNASSSMLYFEHQVESGTKAIATGLSDLLIDGGKFGDQMTRVGKNLAKSLIQDVVQFGFGAVLRAIATADSDLDKLGKKLEGVFIDTTKKGAAPTNVTTPPFMQANTDALAKNTEQTGKDAAAVTKDAAATTGGTAATKIGAGKTGENTEVTSNNTGSISENTGEEKLNTAALKALTTELHSNTTAESLNTVEVHANTDALIALTAAILALKFKLPGLIGSGNGGLNFDIGIGGGGGGGGYDQYRSIPPFGYDPFGPGNPFGGDGWDVGHGIGSTGGNFSVLDMDNVRSTQDHSASLSGPQSLIDMRGSHFNGVTEKLATDVMTKAVKNMRNNRARM